MFDAQSDRLRETSPGSRYRQLPKHFDVEVEPGVIVEQRVEPLARVGCYVPGGRFPLPSSLLMTVVPARVAGVREVVVACPAARAGGPRGRARRRRDAAAAQSAAPTRSRHWPTARGPFRASTRSSGPGNRYVATAKAIVAADRRDCAIDFYAGPTEIVVVAGDADPEWVAADLVAQAEHDADARSILITWRRSFANRVSRSVDRLTGPGSVARRSLQKHGAIVIAPDATDALAIANRIAPEHLVVESEALTRGTLIAGAVFVGRWSAQAAGDYATGSNHVLPTAGAARVRGGLSAADFVRVMSVQRISRAGLARLAPTILPLARAEGLTYHAASVEIRLSPESANLTAMSHYQKPPELYDGLRLHQNENTGGCSPKVLEALAALRPDQVGFYPPYAQATDAVARYLGTSTDRIALTNGLDEGIMALAVAYLQPEVGGFVKEAIVPEPAFEIFRFDTAVAGGRLVQVMPRKDFSFPLTEVLAAITPRTRVVFLTNPNNPTGVAMPLDAIRAVARTVPTEAVVFVDEAYAEFAGTTFIPELAAFPNVIVGRTFSKAFGLAGLRIGCLVGAPAVLDPIRLAIPVYSVSIAAVTAIQAALARPRSSAQLPEPG